MSSATLSRFVDNSAIVRTEEGLFEAPDFLWENFVRSGSPYDYLISVKQESCNRTLDQAVPIWNPTTEVWCAGVTYKSSEKAREFESGNPGFYAKVYGAERPELFFKCLRNRTFTHRGKMGRPKGSKWYIPEPELVVLFGPSGKVIGYTIGNDVSARDIEGENPLYLQQAKIFDCCMGIGPEIKVYDDPVPLSDFTIHLTIERGGYLKVREQVSAKKLNRTLEELSKYLFERTFEDGVFLSTGTGIIPPDDFSCQPGDYVMISVPGLGYLYSIVAE